MTCVSLCATYYQKAQSAYTLLHTPYCVFHKARGCLMPRRRAVKISGTVHILANWEQIPKVAFRTVSHFNSTQLVKRTTISHEFL